MTRIESARLFVDALIVGKEQRETLFEALRIVEALATTTGRGSCGDCLMCDAAVLFDNPHQKTCEYASACRLAGHDEGLKVDD